MKKTAVYLLLCIALALSSCDRPADSEETPSEETPSEIILEADDLDQMQGKFGVATDYSGLTPYNADCEVKSYYFDEPLSELIPDDGYGTILPYVGDILYDADGEVMRYLYGLCTAEGEIITKPIYNEVNELWYYPYYFDNTNCVYCGMISISRFTEDGITKCAVAAADGSWITDFIYDYAYCADGYAVAETYGDELSVIIAPDGSVVYPLTTGEWLTSISEGYALVVRGEDSKNYFINITGEKVFGPYEDASNFIEGLAAVKGESGWCIIDKSGNTVLDIGDEYSYCWPFINGYASLRDDEGGGGVIIDKAGNVLFHKNLYYAGNGIWDEYSIDTNETIYYYEGDAGFTPITYKGSEDIRYTNVDRYFYKQEDGGVTLFKAGDDNGVFIEIEGEGSLYNWMDDDFLLVDSYTNDTSYYGIIDMEGNFLLPLSEEYGYFLKRENDGTMIFHNGKEIIKSDGTVLMKNCVSASSFDGTDYIQAVDKYSSGYITTDGEWILRVSLLNSIPD